RRQPKVTHAGLIDKDELKVFVAIIPDERHSTAIPAAGTWFADVIELAKGAECLAAIREPTRHVVLAKLCIGGLHPSEVIPHRLVFRCCRKRVRVAQEGGPE